MRHHVGDLFHGAQLDPLLWSPLGQAGRPHLPLGVFLVEELEEWLERRGLLSPWRIVLVVVPLLPGPGHLRALWCNFSARAIATVIRSCLSHERAVARAAAARHRRLQAKAAS